MGRRALEQRASNRHHRARARLRRLASAVVPGFEQLIRGSRTYLAVTSLIGLVAFAAGIQMFVTASGTRLTVMVVAIGILWLIARDE